MRVVHRKHDAFEVYIGRPPVYCNPFVTGKDGTLEEVIEKYKRWLMEQPELLAWLLGLRGKVLGCSCAPNPCHGDVLLILPSQGQEWNDLG